MRTRLQDLAFLPTALCIVVDSLGIRFAMMLWLNLRAIFKEYAPV